MKYRVFSLLLVLCLVLSACGGAVQETAPATTAALAAAEPTEAATAVSIHSCISPCSVCGGCRSLYCHYYACMTKCLGCHVCTGPCPICGLCTKEACTLEPCAEKCGGHSYQEAPYPFPGGDYVTQKPVKLSTEKLTFDIDAGLYVPGNLEAMAPLLEEALETVTGLPLVPQADSGGLYSDGKVHVHATRDNLYAGQDWYQGLDTSEMGNAFASPYSHVGISPGDLLPGQDYAIAHELGHMVMYGQSRWLPCQLLSEGFAEYTAYLAIRELEKTHPEAAVQFGSPEDMVFDMAVYDYEQLFAQPIEYWFENTFEYSGNANYAIGFRFMAYLLDTCGDYTKWVAELERQHPFASGGTGEPQVSWQLAVLKDCYGEDVLDGFYPWLRENLDRFHVDPDAWQPVIRDYTGVSGISLYPSFNAFEVRAYLRGIRYRDLYVNLESLRQYLGEYKGLDTSGMKLQSLDPVTVNLYRADGSYTTAKLTEPVSLEGIAYFKLVGEGTLTLLEVTGFEGEVKD